LHPVLQFVSNKERSVHHGPEAPDRHPSLNAHPGFELIFPTEVAEGTGREEIDTVSPASEPASSFGHDRFGASNDTFSVARCDKSEPTPLIAPFRHVCRLFR
jgi:hypothetical protein